MKFASVSFVLCSLAVAASFQPLANHHRHRLSTNSNSRALKYAAAPTDMKTTKTFPLTKEAREGKGLAPDTDKSSQQQQIDADKILAELRSSDLKALKLQCSRRNLRYADFSEQEDYVQAILENMQQEASFSVTGALQAGQVSDLTGNQLDEELMSSAMTVADTPILVDVYATWCGPCKIIAPEMKKVAAELGSACRVAKLDSDRYPEWAGRYKIQGLPTTLLIYKGQVQDRLEGAFTKKQLLELARPYLKHNA
jgi:thioredoxin